MSLLLAIGVPYLHTRQCNSNVRVSAVTRLSVLYSYSTTPDPSFLTALYVVLIMHNSPSSTGVKSWSVFWLLYRITPPGPAAATTGSQRMPRVWSMRATNHASASANMRHRARDARDANWTSARARSSGGSIRNGGGAGITQSRRQCCYSQITEKTQL